MRPDNSLFCHQQIVRIACQKQKSEFSSKKYSYGMEIIGLKTLIKLLSSTGIVSLKIHLSPCPNSRDHF